MRKLIVLLIVSAIGSSLYSQSGIKIYTNLDEAKFKIVFNGELENTIPIKTISYDSLDSGKPHEIQISFTVDTIADIEESINLLEDQFREFEIVKKKEPTKKAAKIGRKIGKFLKIGNHDKENVLYDVFYLEERTKSEFMNN